MSIKLNLKTAPNLVLNPVVHSFLEFLPLNRAEFEEKIKNEVEANPMLEIESSESSPDTEPDENNVFEKKMERADSSFLYKYEENGFFKRDPDKIDKNRAIELFTASKVTLSDHLMNQAMSVFSKKELEIAKHIIYNLNKDGYLDMAIESIASAINTTPEEIERLRNIIRTFDPPGVGSKTLKECLLAQIQNQPGSEKLKFLIENHLDALSKSKYFEIMKQLNIEKEELLNLLTELKRLNPKPGKNFEFEDIDYAEVDLLLLKKNDRYIVKYIEEGMPRLLLSQYYDLMLDKTTDKKTKSYLKEKHRSAKLFIDGIELRKSMIIKIAEYLVEYQKDFLDFGKKWKKPLTMKDVAMVLNYNESTISRSVNNKFIASEKGLLSLKSFFSYGIEGEFGFKHSVETIKDKLIKVISEESKNHPLSDQEISLKLKNLGIKISRRTIRNYRDEMNISNSSQRRTEYNLEGV
ncbi:MAG: RNA polymerase factor sigma-54 [Candidatus Aminicenantes bacterium]|nr:RNA polymerase factor sigma-54 [Candidatus Aminicenantes bacterium]